MYFQSIFLGGDLNDGNGISGALLGFDPREWRHEFREDDVHATDEPHAVDGLRANRGAIRRRHAGAEFHLRRAVPGHGLRAVDLARKPAGHRSVPWGEPLATVYDGLP